MRRQQVICFAALAGMTCCYLSCTPDANPTMSHAGISSLNDAPEPIQKLAREIAGKQGDEVRDIIIKKLGPADRDVGSGLLIVQWDVDAGVLQFHPLSGPEFLPNGGKPIRLLATTNKAFPTLCGRFEMTTLPDPDNHGNQFWLGNLDLNEDMLYAYADSGTNQRADGARKQNYFVNHPKGRFQIHFENGATRETLLESLPDGTVVCAIEFFSADDSQSRKFSITSHFFDRRLTFGADEPPDFEMEKAWDNYWD